jgi:hypothetical protein
MSDEIRTVVLRTAFGKEKRFALPVLPIDVTYEGRIFTNYIGRETEDGHPLYIERQLFPVDTYEIIPAKKEKAA